MKESYHVLGIWHIVDVNKHHNTKINKNENH
jgi:hypothetical protein